MALSDLRAEIDSRALTRTMNMIARDKLPEVAAETLNTTVDAVTREALRNVRKRLIVRQKYTTNSMSSNRAKPYMALNKATGKNINRMFAVAGTMSKYLWMQDTDGGFTEKGESGGPVPIPVLEARTSRNIQKSVRKAYRLGRGQSLSKGPFPEDPMMFIGKPKGKNRRYGIYRRTNRNKKLKMIRNLEHKQVRIKDTNFFDDSLKRYGTREYLRNRYNQLSRKALQGVR